MVARISAGKSIARMVNYNEHKVQHGQPQRTSDQCLENNELHALREGSIKKLMLDISDELFYWCGNTLNSFKSVTK